MVERFVNVAPDTWIDLKPLKALCCQILPTIFDDTMSYYEVLCKTKKLLNDVIIDVDILHDDIITFKDQVKKIINDWETGGWIEQGWEYIDILLKKYVPVGIFFGLTDDGYFTVYYPDSWNEISFRTTELDEHVNGYDYGHLILNY